MHSRHGRDGPGTSRRGRGDPCKMTSTPEDQPPSNSRVAFFYGSGKQAARQAPISAVGVAGQTLSQTPVWDSGWQLDRGFRVRTIIVSGPDGELRRRWAQRILVGTRAQSQRTDEDDAEDLGSAGVREPLPGPEGPGSAAAVVQLDFGDANLVSSSRSA